MISNCIKSKVFVMLVLLLTLISLTTSVFAGAATYSASVTSYDLGTGKATVSCAVTGVTSDVAFMVTRVGFDSASVDKTKIAYIDQQTPVANAVAFNFKVPTTDVNYNVALKFGSQNDTFSTTGNTSLIYGNLLNNISTPPAGCSVVLPPAFISGQECTIQITKGAGKHIRAIRIGGAYYPFIDSSEDAGTFDFKVTLTAVVAQDVEIIFEDGTTVPSIVTSSQITVDGVDSAKNILTYGMITNPATAVEYGILFSTDATAIANITTSEIAALTSNSGTVRKFSAFTADGALNGDKQFAIKLVQGSSGLLSGSYYVRTYVKDSSDVYVLGNTTSN